MSILQFNGELIEFTVLSDEGDGWVAEVWSLGAQGGEVMHIRKNPDGAIFVDLLGQELDADLVKWAISAGQEELKAY